MYDRQPAARRAQGRRVTRKAQWWQTIGNDGTRSQRLSDGRFRETRAHPTLVRLHRATPRRGLANHWKQWDAKPEAVGQTSAKCGAKPYARSAAYANHRKLWDAKPEAKTRLRVMLDRLHRKPRETVGRKARGCGTGFRAKLVRLHGKPRETAGRKTRG